MGDRVCFFISSDESFELINISEGPFRWFLFKEFNSLFISKIKIDEDFLRWVCSVMKLACRGVRDLYSR